MMGIVDTDAAFCSEMHILGQFSATNSLFINYPSESCFASKIASIITVTVTYLG